jgi:hypothetical protein
MYQLRLYQSNQQGDRYFTECVKDVVEEDQDLSFRHLGNIVHALTSIISHSSILVSKARKHWGHDLL